MRMQSSHGAAPTRSRDKARRIKRCVLLVRLALFVPRHDILRRMNRQYLNPGVVLYAVAMAAVIVGVDVVFFRNRFWERLTVNIGIVLVFGAFYLRFFRRP